MALKEVGVKLVVDGLSDFKTKLSSAGTEIDSMGAKLKKSSAALRNVGLGITAAAAGIGIAGLKMASDFEGAMREVNTMMGLSEEEFQVLSDQVLKTAKDVGKAPEEMAQALYQVVSAGIPAGEAIQFLATSAKAAIGGVTDTTTAVDGITTVINAFGMSADDAESVASTMFETVKRGKTTFDELSSYMFQVASQAAALEIPFATVSSALATMTKQGIPTAQATTQLRQAMVALSKPTEEMKTALKNLGYESGRQIIKEKGLQKALALLRKEAKGSDEVFGKMFGSVEAGNAVLALTGDNAETFIEDLEAITEASDDATASTDAYNEMNKSTSRQFEQMTVGLKAMAVEIGQALMPALLKLVEVLKPVLEKIANWVSNNPELTTIILAFAAGLGVLLTALGLIVPAIEAVVAVLAVILSPIGLVVAAVAALAAGIYLLWDNWDTVWGWISDTFKTVSDFILGMYESSWGWLLPGGPLIKALLFVRDHWDVIWPALKETFSTFVNGIKWLWNNILSPIISAIGWAITTLKDSYWDPVWGAMTKAFGVFADGMQWYYNNIMSPVLRGIRRLVGYLQEAWSIAWGVMYSAVAAVTRKLELVITAIRTVRRLADKAWDVLAKIGEPLGSLQHGGTISRAGSYMVGESGPEMVSLPAGASVQSNETINNFSITENYARPESPQSLDLSLQALAAYART